MNSGLYVHVPFCVRKCAYCDFYSVPLTGENVVQKYLEALRQEIASNWPAGFRPLTVFFGGGTPTALGEMPLDELLRETKGRIDHIEEWTVEANPGTLSTSKARLLKHYGVTRVSLGVQSTRPEVLRRLGRIHTPREACDAYEMLRNVGFTNIGIDLMFGVPGQTREMLRCDLAEWLARKPEHISCYALSFEAGTPFARWLAEGALSEMQPDEQREQYELLCELLRDAGYFHYEISNFAQPGFECVHNRIYWEGREYLGYGPSAHSHWGGVRWGNVPDLNRWAEAVHRVGSGREFEERLEPVAKARELLILNLRLTAGISRDEFRQRTGYEWRDVAGEAIERLVNDGLLIEEGDRLRLAEGALFISDAVFRELV